MWLVRLSSSIIALLLLSEGAAAAMPSPYAGWQTRDIKALSAEQIDDLLNGRGVEMALPAELNGYPGPRHVLELADELDLSADQMAQTRRLFEDMRRKAIDLGAQIVEREAILDEMFAAGTVSEATLRHTAEVLGRLNGELRAHHLGYHLAMRGLLDSRQIKDYQRLRGYAATARPGGHGHAGHGGRKGGER
jgi:hypothetical protein